MNSLDRRAFADDASEVKDGTPEEAIESFFTALASGDADTAQSLLTSPEKMAEYCRVQSQLSLAFLDLANAAEEAFGKEGLALWNGIPALQAVERLAEVKPVVNGDEAVWPSNPKAPMKLKRIEGHWKLDLYSSYQKPKQLAISNRLFERIATYVNDVAKGIQSGKLRSVAEAQAELKRQRQLMDKEFAPQLQKAQ